MKNTAKQTLTRAKNFVTDHQVAITIVTTAATTAVVAKKVYGTAYKAAEQFIAEKGLTEEFIQFVPKDIV